MKSIAILLCFMLCSVQVQGQRNAVVIKHMGDVDHFIYPVVFLDDTIQDQFVIDHLKIWPRHVTLKKEWVQSVMVNTQEMKDLRTDVMDLLFLWSDSTEFTHAHGSFEVYIIEEGKCVLSRAMNDPSRSLSFLRALLARLYEYKGLNAEAIAGVIDHLLREFDPNPTMRVVKEP